MGLKDIEKLDIYSLKYLLQKEEKIEMLNKLTMSIIKFRQLYGNLPKNIALDYFDDLEIPIDLFIKNPNDFSEILIYLFNKKIIPFDLLKGKIIAVGFGEFLYKLTLNGYFSPDEFLKILMDKKKFKELFNYVSLNDGLTYNWEQFVKYLLEVPVEKHIEKDYFEALYEVILSIPYTNYHEEVAKAIIGVEGNLYVARAVEEFFFKNMNVLEILPKRPDIVLLIKSIAAFFKQDVMFERVNKIIIHFRQEVKEAIKSGQIANLAFWDDIFPIDSWFVELINMWSRLENIKALEIYGTYFSQGKRSYKKEGIKLDEEYVDYLKNSMNNFYMRSRIRESQDK